MDIAVAHAQLVPEIHERFLLVAAGHPIASIGETLEELSNQLEALGICHLLESVDVGELAADLTRSGHARRFFLRRSQEENNTADRRLALGRTTAFLASLAAGDLTLARDIAAYSPSRWNPNWEYEDDFCFFFFLHTIAMDPPSFPRADQTGILDQLERALEGGDSARLAVCRALVARDPKAIRAAIEARMEEEQAQIEEDRESLAVLEGDLLFWPRSYVSIEGLALLKIAEMVGAPVPGELPRCPALARLPSRPSDQRDFFRELEPG